MAQENIKLATELQKMKKDDFIDLLINKKLSDKYKDNETLTNWCSKDPSTVYADLINSLKQQIQIMSDLIQKKSLSNGLLLDKVSELSRRSMTLSDLPLDTALDSGMNAYSNIDIAGSEVKSSVVASNNVVNNKEKDGIDKVKNRAPNRTKKRDLIIGSNEPSNNVDTPVGFTAIARRFHNSKIHLTRVSK